MKFLHTFACCVQSLRFAVDLISRSLRCPAYQPKLFSISSSQRSEFLRHEYQFMGGYLSNCTTLYLYGQEHLHLQSTIMVTDKHLHICRLFHPIAQTFLPCQLSFHSLFDEPPLVDHSETRLLHCTPFDMNSFQCSK